MSITVRVKGADQVNAALDNLYQNVIVPKINQAIQKAGMRCQKLAKLKCPVDTGRLRASIQYQPFLLKSIVDTNVNYAPDVEFGTSRQRAQPFLYPAYVQARDELAVELKAIAANPIRVVIEDQAA